MSSLLPTAHLWQCPSCIGTCTCAGCTRKGPTPTTSIMTNHHVINQPSPIKGGAGSQPIQPATQPPSGSRKRPATTINPTIQTNAENGSQKDASSTNIGLHSNGSTTSLHLPATSSTSSHSSRGAISSSPSPLPNGDSNAHAPPSVNVDLGSGPIVNGDVSSILSPAGGNNNLVDIASLLIQLSSTNGETADDLTNHNKEANNNNNNTNLTPTNAVPPPPPPPVPPTPPAPLSSPPPSSSSSSSSSSVFQPQSHPSPILPFSFVSSRFSTTIPMMTTHHHPIGFGNLHHHTQQSITQPPPSIYTKYAAPSFQATNGMQSHTNP